MKALSLTQPWAWIILHLGKRIENRSRNLGNYRGTLLLHASKGMTRADYQSALNFVFQRFGREAAEKVPGLDFPLLVRGAVVGVCADPLQGRARAVDAAASCRRTGAVAALRPPPDSCAELTRQELEEGYGETPE